MNRVTDVRYVAYGVTDYTAERSFYADWGLEPVAETGETVWLRVPGSDEHHVVRLRPADTNHVEVIALAAAQRADVEALHARVAAAGCRMIHAPRPLDAPGGGYGFRFFSPDGLPFEISGEVARGPRREIDRWEGLPVRISHVVLHSPDHHALVRFFTDILGFRVSDWLGDFMCFLRCNTAHHRIAILPGPACLNHVAYDMTNLDGMMRGIARLQARDISVRWGPGRHTAGDNTFSYFVTPSGFTVEYTAELETVDFERHVAAVHVPSQRIIDQWGIGVGGPQALPHAAPDPCLFQTMER
ncbi:MAG: VOC family protein [Gammaproteobacteria bacterium]|nr:VOC family protein [Gammaproteobacteria bacterium]